MDNSIYITLSRQTTLFRDMEVTANNIANMNTTGYNAEKLTFSEHLVDGRLDGKLGNKLSYARDPESYRDTRTGSIKTTGNPLDMAISGPGYFIVETPLGQRYSKAGNFQIDANGTLVTPSGYPVLSADGGTVILPQDAKNILVADDGRVVVDNEEVGQVGVAEFTSEQQLKRLGNNLYSAEGQEQLERQPTTRIVQGAIETSNVSGVQEMVRLVQLQRSVASTAKFVEAMYDMERKVSNVYTKAQQS